MFDMDSFEKELDEQNAALESMLADLDADGSGEMSMADSLLAKVQESVDVKCNTMEACESMLAGLEVEISKYNDAVRAMKEATESFRIDGDKAALKDALTPASESLRNTYNLVTLESVDSTSMITDKEIQTLHDFLIGSKDIIKTQMSALESMSEFDSSNGICESFLTSVESTDLDIAEEGLTDALKNARDAFIKWIQRIISKFSKKASTEKDSKKKGKLSSIIAKLKGIFSKGKNATDIDGVKDAKSEAEDAIEEFEDDFYDAYNSKKAELENGNESAMIDLADKQYRLAIEAYGIANDVYQKALETASNSSIMDEIDSFNSVMESAISSLKSSLAKACDKMAGKCRKKMAKHVGVAQGNNKSEKKWYNFWNKMYEWFANTAKKLRGEMSPEEVEKVKKDVDEKTETCQKAEAKQNTETGEVTKESFTDDSLTMCMKAVEAAYDFYLAADTAAVFE